MKAPFPWFGGKRTVVDQVWQRFGRPKQYIEPFAGSAAVLLGARQPASLEVVGDLNGFIANFWRAVKFQPDAVAEEADYPVSHVDLHARHRWLMDRRVALADGLVDAEWPGDARAAGWWLWGQCAWIGSGWCDWMGKIPHVTDAGRGVQAVGQIPHVTDAGMGIHGATTNGRAALSALRALSERLCRVRVIHGGWTRCLNHHYGGNDTAVFLDPPYVDFEGLYGATKPVAKDVEAWCREHPHLRIALCGHVGDYDLPGWDAVQWSRGGNTYGGTATKDSECIWYSPACLSVQAQGSLDL